ncbi:MAG: hypothetical protein KDA97_06085, partial [Acidimicrobiales bacterium]|nr:hypothetical protein [Acidimicrobiales bacterium]
NEDLGPNEAFLSILGRGYPRAAPGRIDELVSDIDTGWLKVRASAAEAGGELVVWTPTADDGDHRIHVEGLEEVREHVVEGGRIVTATVATAGPYALWVGEPDAVADDLLPPPASPRPARPSYTG